MPSAVLIGTFAPDFEYFLRLAPDRGFGHTPKGILELSFPLAILVLWIFHTFVKVPVTGLLPNGIRHRLRTHLGRFSFRGTKRFVWIGVSVLLGIGTHVLWDSITHPYYWPYRHWALLRQTVQIPAFGTVRYFKLFQHGSTVIGITILVFWIIHWYQSTEPAADLERLPSQRERIAVMSVMASVAVIGGIARAAIGGGITEHFPSAKFAGEVIVTTIALAWWQLVIYGVIVTLKVLRSRNDGLVG